MVQAHYSKGGNRKPRIPREFQEDFIHKISVNILLYNGDKKTRKLMFSG
jgi:hypothetical protein